jgi:prolyl-tRNA synthetase
MILNDVYSDFVEKEMALPVIRGQKTDKEKFAGALRTYTIETMMQDGRALQSGTSHNLGQNFAKVFNINFTDVNNQAQFAWTTSWGVSTRLIGALIMAHSDDEGLVVPPRLAAVQVVVVPIFKNDTERARVLPAVEEITSGWKGRIRFKIDDRDNVSPGFKYNEWEMKGVPIRIEVGPRDVEKGSVALARRDRPGREGKEFVPQAGLTEMIEQRLSDIQQSLFDRAFAFRAEHTVDVRDMEELRTAVETGFAVGYWDGTTEDENRIQDDTKATIRAIPFDQPEKAGRCIATGRETSRVAVFARSY